MENDMKYIFIYLVKFYKKFISPMLPKSCRYHPTCSEYAIDALQKHGAVKGSIMSFFRILRCNPFFKGGLDPVPDRFTLKRGEYEEETKQNKV
jgi:putative membrane protein insertion efficiency factor